MKTRYRKTYEWYLSSMYNRPWNFKLSFLLGSKMIMEEVKNIKSQINLFDC